MTARGQGVGKVGEVGQKAQEISPGDVMHSITVHFKVAKSLKISYHKKKFLTMSGDGC